MTLVLRYAARSDVGRVRAKNDDSAYVGRHLAVLADGMGGHVGGDVASASTVLDLAPLDAVGYEDPATVLPDEIQNANLILNELVHANPKLAGMGTTCTAGLLAGTTLYMAHIGDSRAYRLADGEFSQVTTDHTFVQKLVDEGRLEAGEAPFHPNKNVLMRVLGDVDASPELDVFEVPVAPGERWLFCSDGLTDVVSPEKIHEVLRDSEALNQAVDTLVDLTLKGGAPDNVTVVAFEIAEGTAEELAPVPDVHLSEQALAAAHPPEVGPVSGLLLREDLDAVAELGYHRNENARSIRPGHSSGLIGVAITNIANPYYSTFALGVEEEAALTGRRILLGNTSEDATREAELVGDFLGRRVDGLIVVPAGPSSAHLAHSQNQGVPVVLASRRIDGLAVDTDMRWTLLTGLAAAGEADAATIAEEAKGDNTATDRKSVV